MKHKHIPAIVHRTGGVAASALNACAACGCYIILGSGNPANWVEVSEAQAERIRAGQVVPENPMKFCTNCLQEMKPVLLVDSEEAWACVTEDCVRRGLVTVFGYDRPEYPATEREE